MTTSVNPSEVGILGNVILPSFSTFSPLCPVALKPTCCPHSSHRLHGHCPCLPPIRTLLRLKGAELLPWSDYPVSSHHSVTTALSHSSSVLIHHFLYSPSVVHPVIRCPLAHWSMSITSYISFIRISTPFGIELWHARALWAEPLSMARVWHSLLQAVYSARRSGRPGFQSGYLQLCSLQWVSYPSELRVLISERETMTLLGTVNAKRKRDWNDQLSWSSFA